jgi:hypothetical protein
MARQPFLVSDLLIVAQSIDEGEWWIVMHMEDVDEDYVNVGRIYCNILNPS